MVDAKKSLGQNFLKDNKVLQQIIEAAELDPQDTILEIGPGKGALTETLLNKVKTLIAVELDDRLIPLLKESFGKYENFKLVHEDALKYNPPKEDYKIVANIPYYITSPILNHFLLEQFQNREDGKAGNPPKTLVLMVQKEVAEKIIAKDGRHSVLSLQVHLFGEPELVCIVPKTAFDPIPKVDSAVIKIRVNKRPQIEQSIKKLFWLFHISFAQKRKKLSNNLAAALHKEPKEIRPILEELGIDPDARAEALTLEEWNKLSEYLTINFS